MWRGIIKNMSNKWGSTGRSTSIGNIKRNIGSSMGAGGGDGEDPNKWNEEKKEVGHYASKTNIIIKLKNFFVLKNAKSSKKIEKILKLEEIQQKLGIKMTKEDLEIFRRSWTHYKIIIKKKLRKKRGNIKYVGNDTYR